jgi:hypothetical protein
MNPIEPTASQIAAIKESLDRNPQLNDYARAQSLENMLHDLTKPRMSREEAIEQYKMIARQSRQRQTSQESTAPNGRPQPRTSATGSGEVSAQ